MTDEIPAVPRDGRRVWAWLAGVLLLAAAGGLGFLWWKAPDWYADPRDRPGTVAITRVGFAIALAGVLVLAGLLQHARVVRKAQRANRGEIRAAIRLWEMRWLAGRAEDKAERASLVTDRYTAAVEQLGDQSNISVRLGGIYALEQIAIDSERDQTTVVEVLSAFVRENARGRVPGGIDVFGIGHGATGGRPATDVQAALTVLGRLPDRPGVPRADFTGASLAGADLIRSTLRGATLSGANLAGAWLVGADLADARLVDANLTGARLDQAVLSGAKLDVADLSGSRMEGTDLSGARLAAADLTDARQLSQAQIDSAQGDHRTKLPANLRQPLSWLLPAAPRELPAAPSAPGDTQPNGTAASRAR